MPRRGGSKIQKREAEAIARKLDAVIEPGGNHLQAVVRYDGMIIANYGIRHGRRTGHGHVPGELHLNQSQAVALARCTITPDAYFEILRRKGLLPTN